MTAPRNEPEPARAVAVVWREDRVLTIKRFLRSRSASDCVMCRFDVSPTAATCPGHNYAVLPGGGIEPGETPRQAAERELAEETTLSARAGRLLWKSTHNAREAFYFQMDDVKGDAVLAGQEAIENGLTNSFHLVWSTMSELTFLALYPDDVEARLREFVPVNLGKS